jgi:hypothetical protein
MAFDIGVAFQWEHQQHIAAPIDFVPIPVALFPVGNRVPGLKMCVGKFARVCAPCLLADPFAQSVGSLQCFLDVSVNSEVCKCRSV